MKTIVITLSTVMLLAGCAAQWPGCNDKFPDSARIVQIADKYEVCLREHVGNGFIVANSAAIGLDAYTIDDALTASRGVVTLMEDPLSTEIGFRDYVFDELGRFPGLIDVAWSYVAAFDSEGLVDKGTRDIVIKWLKERVIPILERHKERVSGGGGTP